MLWWPVMLARCSSRSPSVVVEVVCEEPGDVGGRAPGPGSRPSRRQRPPKSAPVGGQLGRRGAIGPPRAHLDVDAAHRAVHVAQDARHRASCSSAWSQPTRVSEPSGARPAAALTADG